MIKDRRKNLISKYSKKQNQNPNRKLIMEFIPISLPDSS